MLSLHVVEQQCAGARDERRLRLLPPATERACERRASAAASCASANGASSEEYRSSQSPSSYRTEYTHSSAEAALGRARSRSIQLYILCSMCANSVARESQLRKRLGFPDLGISAARSAAGPLEELVGLEAGLVDHAQPRGCSA